MNRDLGVWTSEDCALVLLLSVKLGARRGENLEHNLALVEQLRAIADERDVTVAQVAIAWVLSRGENVVALVGARRRERLHEGLGASGLELSPVGLEHIEAAVPAGAAAGPGYAGFLMGELDSERSAA